MKIYTLTAFENIKKPDNNKLEKDFKKLCKNDIIEKIFKKNRVSKNDIIEKTFKKNRVNSNKSKKKKILKYNEKKLTQFFKNYK